MSRMIAQSFVWNAAQFISAPIMAIHKYVDEIQLFDGAFSFMRDAGFAKTAASTDNTRNVVLSLKLNCDLTWFPCTDFYENEVAKKMFMQRWQFWKPGEWKYILSDDELPVGNVEADFKRVKLDKKALCGWVRMWELDLSKAGIGIKDLGWKPRFLKWQEGLHWEGKHYHLYNAKGIHRDKWPKIILTEMAILHLKYMRPPERLTPQLKYERLDL